MLEPISDLMRGRHGRFPVDASILLFERRSAKLFANDLIEDRGFAITKSVFPLRFVKVSLMIYRFVRLEGECRMHPNTQFVTQ